MATDTLESWVLHKSPSGDTSARVTFFTREKGMVVCLCKGGRTPKKQAFLQPFIPLWLAIDTRKDWYYTRNIEATGSFLQLKANALFAGLYVNEIVYYALAPLDAQPELFDVYLQTLHGLAVATDRLIIETLLRRFEWALLQACGVSLSIDSIVNNKQYQFVAGSGFIPCHEGGLSGRDIVAFAQGQFIDLQVLKTAKIIMRQAINHLLGGREIKSRALYSSLSC